MEGENQMRTYKQLTATEVASIEKPGRYGDGDGLWLQVSKWGTKSWQLRFMLNGRARHMGLGSVRDFTLKEARERAREMRQMIADGIDPIEARHERRMEQAAKLASQITFKKAAEEYIEMHRDGWKNPKHIAQWENTLAAYAFPVFGNLPVDRIDTTQVMKVLEPIWKAKTETASRLRGRIEKILGWATTSGYRIGDNPARWRGHLENLLPAKGKIQKVQHQAAMPYRELPEFMVELRDVDGMSARALEFTILTAARTSEVLLAKWDEIDGDIWVIPAERMKAGKEHRVPLSNQALELLASQPREMGSRYIFPGARQGRPMSNMAMLKLLRTRRPGLTVHGFRSTFRDWTAEQTSYPREIAEQALAHANNDRVEAAYQRSDLLNKRRKLMSAWAAFASTPTDETGKVVAIGSAS
jgi:integrase